MQHLAPMIIERVNRFFGYEAVDKLAFRQGRAARSAPKPQRPAAAPVPKELGEGLRQIADPELRACLESLASKLAGSRGVPAIEPIPTIQFQSSGANDMKTFHLILASAAILLAHRLQCGKGHN